ncbi:alpha-2-HS-glycoprotein 1 [Synchiropus picturatus]
MKSFCVPVLLSAALVLWGAHSLPLEIECNGDGIRYAGKLAEQAIEKNHDHGYKFLFQGVNGSTINQVQDGCEMTLHIILKETSCTVTNPKPASECKLRDMYDEVTANCTVMLDVKNGVGKVTRYECDTRQEVTDIEMMQLCPDCPVLAFLNNAEGLKAVHDAIQQFNKNSSNTNIYVLHEVGRIISYYMMSAGMMYSPSFTLVETRCPMGSRIALEACVPLCPKRAKHAYCTARYSTVSGLQSVDCEYYPAEDNQTLALGEKEPVCERPHTGPPAPPGPPGPPGSIPHIHPHPPRPHFHSHLPCREARPGSVRKIHPICNWPVEQMLLPQQKTEDESK